MVEASDWHSKKAAVPRCLYCGVVGPWWECSCKWVAEVKAGTRPAPKVKRLKDGRTVIELDAETIARNPLGMARYKREAEGC